MTATVHLGRYAGVRVEAHWSVALIVVLLAELLAVGVLPVAAPGQAPTGYWITALTVTLLFLVSLLGHELAHAAVARRLGIRVRGVTLFVLGGVTTFEGEPPSPGADALVAVVGPATSGALAGVYWLVATWINPGWLAGLPAAGLTWLAVVNLLLAAFNLLPAAPLDGGRLLRAWLWWRGGDRDRAAARAATVGQAFGYALITVGVLELLLVGSLGGLWLGVVGWFVASGAGVERAQSLVRGTLSRITVGDVAEPNPVVAPGWLTVDGFLDQLAEHGVRHRVFPVVDLGGAPVGVISLRDLIATRPDTRRGTRVQDVARRLDQRTVAQADEPLTDLLGRAAPRPGADAVVVLRDHRLVGLLTAADVERALDLARLGRPPRTPADHQPA